MGGMGWVSSPLEWQRSRFLKLPIVSSTTSMKLKRRASDVSLHRIASNRIVSISRLESISRVQKCRIERRREKPDRINEVRMSERTKSSMIDAMSV
jgi:hypothetical protein